MVVRPTDGFGWSNDAMASFAGRGYIDSCENAGWSCVLLPEEGGQGRQVVYLS